MDLPNTKPLTQFSLRTASAKPDYLPYVVFGNPRIAASERLVARQVGSYVCPNVAVKNLRYFGGLCLKFCSYFLPRHGSSNRQNLYYFRFFQNRIANLFSFGVAVFLIPVRHVLPMRANKQMVGVDTGWIVASMAHAKPLRDWPKMNQPRESMGGDSLALCHNAPVSAAVRRTRPHPTGWGLFNSSPKASKCCFRKLLGNRAVDGIVALHTSLSLLVCRALGFPDRKGISFSSP